MKKSILLVVACLLLFSPAVIAFSLADFFNDVFDSITGFIVATKEGIGVSKSADSDGGVSDPTPGKSSSSKSKSTKDNIGDVGREFTCGRYTCYDDNDQFTDYCLDESAVPALCGECMDDSWCEKIIPGSTCSYASKDTPCEYGSGNCNQCCGAELSDIDGDINWNVLNIVNLADYLLDNNYDNSKDICAGYRDIEGGYNALNIIQLAECILENSCG